MNQLDFINDFEAADRDRKAAEDQRKFAHEIIDKSSSDRRVTAVLHALVSYGFDFGRAKDERDNWLVTLAPSDIGKRIGKSDNTVRGYLKIAYETSYVELLNPRCTNEKRTYVVHWRSILGPESNTRHATRTAEVSEPREHATRTPSDAMESSNRDPDASRDSELRTSVSKTEVLKTETEVLNSSVLRSSVPPSDSPLKTPENVFSRDISRKRFPESSQGADTTRAAPDLAWGFWTVWEKALATRDLSNPVHVHELCLIAIEGGAIRAGNEFDRRRVFEQAAHNEQLWRAGKADRKRIFFSNVPANRWWCTCAAEDEGRRTMAEVQDLVPITDAPDNEKERQKRRLAAAVAAGKFQPIASTNG